MIKAIVFDFDGVIHDTREVLWNLHLKFCPEDNYENWVQECFSGNVNKYVDKTYSKEEQEELWELWHHAHKDMKIEKEIKQFLYKLHKQGLPLFIISSNAERNLKMYCFNNELHKLFKEVYGTETHKSKVEKFRILFHKYALKPEEVIFITDTTGDIKEAREVNVQSIGVDWGYHEFKTLKKEKPLRVVKSVKELEKELKKLL